MEGRDEGRVPKAGNDDSVEIWIDDIGDHERCKGMLPIEAI